MPCAATIYWHLVFISGGWHYFAVAKIFGGFASKTASALMND
jgi:hypothetical protein